MENRYLAFCNNTECEKKDECLRFSEEEGIDYIKFKNLIKEDLKCEWFKKIVTELTIDESDGEHGSEE